MTVAEAARAWQAAGVCTIPIAPGGNKRPAIRWKDYQTRLPVDAELTEWFGNGHPYGLALLMGKVSGGMEMTEIEGRAISPENISEIANHCDALEIGEVWDRLMQGYVEESPGGGLHFIYRVTGQEVPGNEKIASRPCTPEELASKPEEKIKVLAETRGEGGYVVAAPTPGICHESGRPWVKWQESLYGQVATLTAEERFYFHTALKLALHREPQYDRDHPTQGIRPLPVPSLPVLPPVERGTGGELRPGDDFESTDWSSDLLLGSEWTLSHTWGQTRYWTRPGKDPRDGISATTGHDGARDRLFVFSTSTIFPTQEPITKFRAYSLLHHRGDDSAAASALRQLGFGGERQVQTIPGFQFDGTIDKFSLTDVGNGHRLAKHVNGLVKWLTDEQQFYRFDGTRWSAVSVESIDRLAFEVAELMCLSDDEATRKWGKRSLGSGAVRSMREMFKLDVLATSADFDKDPYLLNVRNGTLDLRDLSFREHRPEDMITRMFCASYNPEARSPKFLAFLSFILPDGELREYVQRAAGSSLLPLRGRRTIFLLHGPSGTGKSQFCELLQHLFCDYGTTAPASTFRTKREGNASNDLHRLRGKRFVATSETSDSATFDEEVLKRLTGGDTMSTRELYQKHVEWVPECSVWIATNFPPRFTSDDNAVWRRAKLIPFQTVFGENGAPTPVTDYARTELVPEADGILNWLIAGLRDYMENGIQEPPAIAVAASAMRRENDSVAQFMEEQEADGYLQLGDQGGDFRIRTVELYASYQMWASQSGERPVGRRRFVNRLTLLPHQFTSVKAGGQMFVYGVRRSAQASILGSFGQGVPD